MGRVAFNMNMSVRKRKGRGGCSYRGAQLTMRLYTAQKAFG